MYDFEARVDFNDTVPNHYRKGMGSHDKTRQSIIFCKDRVPAFYPVVMNRINGKTICGTFGGKEFE